MYQFPEGFYTEVTVKKEILTTIVVIEDAPNQDTSVQKKTDTKSYAIIEMTNGETKQTVLVRDVRKIEEEMEALALRIMQTQMTETRQSIVHRNSERTHQSTAHRNREEIHQSTAQERNLTYGNMNITHLPILMKENLAKACAKRGMEKMRERFCTAFYEDCYCITTVVTSEGTERIQDEQNARAGYTYHFTAVQNADTEFMESKKRESMQNEKREATQPEAAISCEKKIEVCGHYFEELAEQAAQL